MTRIILAFAICLGLLFTGVVPHEAMAKPKRTKKQAADPKNELIIKALGGLKWGDSVEDVVKKLREEAMDEVRNDPNLKKDRVRLQKAMKVVRERSKKLKDTYTELKGSSNLEVGVIGDEFISDNGESFLRVSDTRSQRYYFFYHDRLYKYVVAYNQSYLENVDFEGFAAATIAKYGRPTDASYDEDSDEDVLTSLEWDTPNVILVVKNKQRFFGTYTMTFAQPGTYKTWARLKERKVAAADDSKVSAEVRSLLQTGEVRSSGSAVSSIVGDTRVDVSKVMPKEKEEEEKKEEEEVKKKEEKKKKKKKKKKKRSKHDFSDLKAKSGEGLIIY